MSDFSNTKEPLDSWLKTLASNHFLFITMLSLILVCPPSILGLQSTPNTPGKVGPRNKSEEWVKYQINGIPYEVALEWPMGKESGWGSERVLFVYLEPKYYSRDNLFLVFGNIGSKIPQPTSLNVTMLTDRVVLKTRVERYSGLVMSNETPYTRLTVESDTCCPLHFTGAQFDRYTTHAHFVICTDGKPNEINADYDSTKQNLKKAGSKL